MECVVAFLLIVGGALALGGFGAFNKFRFGRGNAALAKLAARWGGVYISGGLFGSPTVQFQYGQDQVPVVVYSAKHSKRGYAHVVVAWPDPTFRCEVLSRWSYLPQQYEFRGLEEVSIDLRFGQRYIVLTNDPHEARTLLNTAVCWQIERLRSLFGDDFVHISFKHGELEVVKQRLFSNLDQADDLVRAILAVFDQAMLTRSVGIEFVSQDEIQVVQDAVCQVCGEEIVTDMVFCRRCKTPHHLECWQYVGACAIYGCQETHYVAPRIAEPGGANGLAEDSVSSNAKSNG